MNASELSQILRGMPYNTTVLLEGREVCRVALDAAGDVPVINVAGKFEGEIRGFSCNHVTSGYSEPEPPEPIDETVGDLTADCTGPSVAEAGWFGFSMPAAIEACVRKELSLPQHVAITQAHCDGITSLRASRCGIVQVEWVKLFPNLTSLVLRDNQISHIGAIGSLAKLQELDIRENPVADLSPLRGAKALRRLNVTDTHLRDHSRRILDALEVLGVSVLRLSALSTTTS